MAEQRRDGPSRCNMGGAVERGEPSDGVLVEAVGVDEMMQTLLGAHRAGSTR